MIGAFNADERLMISPSVFSRRQGNFGEIGVEFSVSLRRFVSW